MMFQKYREQVNILLQVLPYVAREEVFALKGGTAINLFVRNMPRLSVDIDLTYLPLDDRPAAMKGIAEGLSRIRERIGNAGLGVTAPLHQQSGGEEAKLICQSHSAQVKIEVNTIIRGHIFPTRLMDITEAVENEFSKFVTMRVVSHAELFGGKICAALDRQHPRDIFDIHQLFEQEGFTDAIRLGFIAMLVSHSRPMHEIINPHLLDQKDVFQHHFSGMTLTPFSYEDYQATRSILVRKIQDSLTADDRSFLLSFKTGEPDWDLLPLKTLHLMPAVQWKLANIVKLKAQNPVKHAALRTALDSALMTY
ncbi:MAG: nucleotidyl transferase AbiEii/AbiGii toxin family protein [Chlorobiaceae bacterium]